MAIMRSPDGSTACFLQQKSAIPVELHHGIKSSAVSWLRNRGFSSSYIPVWPFIFGLNPFDEDPHCQEKQRFKKFIRLQYAATEFGARIPAEQ
jgi:hypothetical protein